MRKNALKNYTLKRNYPMILVLLPCTLWVLMGLWVCYVTSSGTVGIIAVLFPPFIILLSYILARRHKLLGGLTLLIEGILLIGICINYLTVSQNIIFLTMFVLPLTISSLLFLSSTKITEVHTYN